MHSCARSIEARPSDLRYFRKSECAQGTAYKFWDVRLGKERVLITAADGRDAPLV